MILVENWISGVKNWHPVQNFRHIEQKIQTYEHEKWKVDVRISFVIISLFFFRMEPSSLWRPINLCHYSPASTRFGFMKIPDIFLKALRCTSVYCVAKSLLGRTRVPLKGPTKATSIFYMPIPLSLFRIACATKEREREGCSKSFSWSIKDEKSECQTH